MILLIIHVMETGHWSHSVFLFPMYIMTPLVRSILISFFGRSAVGQSLWVGLPCAAAPAVQVIVKNIDDRDMVCRPYLWLQLLDVAVAIRLGFFQCLRGTSMRGILEITVIVF